MVIFSCPFFIICFVSIFLVLSLYLPSICVLIIHTRDCSKKLNLCFYLQLFKPKIFPLIGINVSISDCNLQLLMLHPFPSLLHVYIVTLSRLVPFSPRETFCLFKSQNLCMGACTGLRGMSGGLGGTHYGQYFGWWHTHIFCYRYYYDMGSLQFSPK